MAKCKTVAARVVFFKRKAILHTVQTLNNNSLKVF